MRLVERLSRNGTDILLKSKNYVKAPCVVVQCPSVISISTHKNEVEILTTTLHDHLNQTLAFDAFYSIRINSIMSDPRQII